LGGYRVYAVTSYSVVVVWLGQEEVHPAIFAALFLGCVFGLLTIVAGVLLVRLGRAGRVFGLWGCSGILAGGVLSFGAAVVLKLLTSSPAESPDLLFWFTHSLSIVVFLVGIILIARWHPPRKIEQLGRIFD